MPNQRDEKPVQCPNCTRKFAKNSHCYQHIKAAHGGKGKAAFKSDSDDDDESFADRAIQAMIDRDSGIDNPDIDWLI